MEFPKTTREEDVIANEEAFRIYGELRKKYPDGSVRDLDIILNSLCFSIARLFLLNSLPMDKENCIELVGKILRENLKIG